MAENKRTSKQTDKHNLGGRTQRIMATLHLYTNNTGHNAGQQYSYIYGCSARRNRVTRYILYILVKQCESETKEGSVGRVRIECTL